MTSRALFLFAPKFRELGAGVATELARRGVVAEIDGICTGGLKTVERVRAGLGTHAGKLVDVAELEADWSARRPSLEELKDMERVLGTGSVQRILTADRRVGAGFVVGGLCRPDRIKAKAIADGAEFPIAYVHGMFRYLETMLEERRPDFVFLYAHASAVSACLAELCRIKAIPLLGLSTARLERRFLIDEHPIGLLRPVQRAFKAKQERFKDFQAEATALLAEFRQRPEAPAYEAFNRTVRDRQTPARQFFRALKITLAQTISGVRRRKNISRSAAKMAWFEFGIACSRRRVNRRWFRQDSPSDRRFVFYPLHVDPEASTMVLSPEHTDQLSVIEALAKALPADAILVVKEHEPMIGRRPRGFYRRIAQMPRVVLVGPEKSGTWWVRNSDLTAVITGTAAWEAVRLGKPALIIGNSPFLAIAQGMMHEPCLARLPQALAAAFDLPPADDAILVRYISALLEQSFDFDTGILWGDFQSYDEKTRSEGIEVLADAIERRYAQMAPTAKSKPDRTSPSI